MKLSVRRPYVCTGSKTSAKKEIIVSICMCMLSLKFLLASTSCKKVSVKKEKSVFTDTLMLKRKELKTALILIGVFVEEAFCANLTTI